MNYKLDISYDGTNFFGWQTQSNQRSIQEDIELSLENIFSKKIKLYGSGRTDSGVHAFNQIANFTVDTTMNTDQIQKAVNSKINNDIYIKNCETVDDSFHARYSATNREYIYYISKIFSPFNYKYEWRVKYNLNEELLIKCSKLINGNINFVNFCKTSSLKEKNECLILISEWDLSENKLSYKISANRFLHHMVRLLVGTMIEVGRGRIDFNDFSNLLNNKSNKISAIKAPPNGLFLKNVFYK